MKILVLQDREWSLKRLEWWWMFSVFCLRFDAISPARFRWKLLFYTGWFENLDSGEFMDWWFQINTQTRAASPLMRALQTLNAVEYRRVLYARYSTQYSVEYHGLFVDLCYSSNTRLYLGLYNPSECSIFQTFLYWTRGKYFPIH